MSTAFPTALDTLTDPNPAATLAVNGHSAMHTNLNDAVEAMQAAIGVMGATSPPSIRGQLATHLSEANPHPQYPTAVRVSALESFDASLASAFAFANTLTYSSSTSVLSPTNTSTTTRDLPFNGWSERYSPAGVVFNAVKVKTISKTAALTSSRWKSLNIVIRTGANSYSANSPVIAVGSVQVSESADTLNDLLILLKHPVTGQPITLSDASFTGGEYMIGIYALNSVGAPASCGSPNGTMSNTLGQSYYFLSSSSSPTTNLWTATVGGPIRVGFEHLYLVSPQETNVYNGPSSALAVALADMAYPVPETVIPPYVFACEGRECNIYFDNLHLSAIVDYEHNVDTSTSVGKQQRERFTWIPSGAQSSGTITIDVHQPRNSVKLSTKTAQLRAAAASAGTGVTRKLIVVGDSLVNAGIITQTLLDISGADAMHVTTLGTQGTGPNNHEGRAGWTINMYVTSGSPFYISSAVNFPQYLTNNSIAVPDWVLVALGINDCFGQTDDTACSTLADTELAKLDTLITSIKAAGAGVKVGLVIPSPPSFYADSFGESYGAAQTRWRYKRNILIWARQLISRYTGQEASRIYLIPSNTALDTVNNMSTASVAAVNSRSSVTMARQNNGVHPGSSGYQQIADAIWAFIKYQG